MIFYDFVSSGASLSARLRSKKVSRNRYLLFLYLWRKFTCRQRCEKQKMGGVPLFAQWACKCPCGKQKGKALRGATIGSVVVNPSLSALNNLQGVEFRPCRFFCAQKFCYICVPLSSFAISLEEWLLLNNLNLKKR